MSVVFGVVLLALAVQAAPTLIPVLDIGSEFMKVVVVNPAGGGYPLLDMALNEQSERKTAVLVGFERDGEIRTGDDAVSLRIRAPERCVYGFMDLLGEKVGSEAVNRFLARNPQFRVKIVPTHRGTVAFEGLISEEPLALEILIALFLRAVVTKFSVGDLMLTRETVKEIALVAPAHFTAAQTGLLVECATIARLSVRTVVSELAGAAIEYAVGGQNSAAGAKQTVAVFGMGGAHSSATLFAIERSREKNSKHATVTTLGSSASVPVGGLTFDAALQDHLARVFTATQTSASPSTPSPAATGAATHEPIATNAKAMARLARAAKTAKEDLSVSPSATVHLERLHAQINLDVTITLAEFENLTAASRAQAVEPVAQLLKSSKTDVTVVELFGGGLRVPAVARDLLAAHKGVTIGRHINGDEAAVFGAAYLVAAELKLPVPTTLAYTPGAIELAQRHTKLEKPLGPLVKDYQQSVALLDVLEIERLAAQGHDLGEF
eukprot:m.238108 g.238108  ORF g.238108 m.238108 type:complete len:494 (+) comp21576_c0_seq1:51-1532(+)